MTRSDNDWGQLSQVSYIYVAPVLDVETAPPASYALTPETGTVPAYLLRITT